MQDVGPLLNQVYPEMNSHTPKTATVDIFQCGQFMIKRWMFFSPVYSDKPNMILIISVIFCSFSASKGWWSATSDVRHRTWCKSQSRWTRSTGASCRHLWDDERPKLRRFWGDSFFDPQGGCALFLECLERCFEQLTRKVRWMLQISATSFRCLGFIPDLYVDLAANEVRN